MKKNRREVKYPALKPQLNLKIRYDEIADVSYTKKLSEELNVCWCPGCQKCLDVPIKTCVKCTTLTMMLSEKQFMNHFMDGWVNASRNSLLFKDKKSWKQNEDRNNARNRCIITKAKSHGKLVYFSDLSLKSKKPKPTL